MICFRVRYLWYSCQFILEDEATYLVFNYVTLLLCWIIELSKFSNPHLCWATWNDWYWVDIPIAVVFLTAGIAPLNISFRQYLGAKFLQDCHLTIVVNHLSMLHPSKLQGMEMSFPYTMSITILEFFSDFCFLLLNFNVVDSPVKVWSDVSAVFREGQQHSRPVLSFSLTMWYIILNLLHAPNPNQKRRNNKSYGPAEGILYHIHMALHFTKEVVRDYLTAARDVRIIGQCINRS